MSAGRPHVLIIGGTGTFGSRLARLLVRRGQFRLTLGGRNAKSATGLIEALQKLDADGTFGFVKLTRATIDAETLSAIRPSVVVDCAGPFQASGTGVVEAAIGARCHYVDLADSRSFIAEVGRLDDAARAAGVTVVTGASSTPALSSAVLDALTEGWEAIDTIDAAIVPGNKTPKGHSVIAGILSWVGQPLRVFEDGAWRRRRGWGVSGWVEIEGLGRRRAALVDVPDIEVFPARYSPRVRAHFRAGMELGLLHGLVGLAGLLVRARLIRSAAILAPVGLAIARALEPFGTADGGMVVDVAGIDAQGVSHLSRWSLIARDGLGPYVPAIPAAAIVTAICQGAPPPPGARMASGLLALSDLDEWFDELGIATARSGGRRGAALFRRTMGETFAILPPVTQRLHRGSPAIVAEGEAEVKTATNPIARLLAAAFGLPQRGGVMSVRVVIEARDDTERWTRFFDGVPMRSVMRHAGAGLVEEQFGVAAMTMRLVASPKGLDMVMQGGRLGPVPLPRFLLPRITARERVVAERHAFDVEIALPLVGRLVAYRGSLAV